MKVVMDSEYEKLMQLQKENDRLTAQVDGLLHENLDLSNALKVANGTNRKLKVKNKNLAAQVEELKEMLEKLTARGVEYLNDEDINDDEDRAAIESNFNDKILESRKLLTRIGEDDE